MKLAVKFSAEVTVTDASTNDILVVSVAVSACGACVCKRWEFISSLGDGVAMSAESKTFPSEL
jgi:hypothetical protein